MYSEWRKRWKWSPFKSRRGNIHHDGRVDDYALIYSNSVVRTMAYVGKRVKIGSTCTISNEKIIEPDRVIEDGVTE